MIALGFIGLGNYANDLAKAARKCSGIRIAGGCSRSEANRSAFSDRFECETFERYDQLLASGIDAMVVVTPNHLHVQHAVQAAAAGKHVFVEKPICNTLEDADRMIEACHAAGVLLAVGHQERRYAPYRRIGQMIRNGEFGKIFSFEANLCGNLIARWGLDDWRFSDQEGGPILHKGIHKIDTLHYLFGPVHSVATMSRPLEGKGAISETTVSVMTYKNGVIGSLSAGFANNNNRFSIYGEHLSVYYSGHGNTFTVKNEEQWTFSDIVCPEVNPLVEEMEEFALAIEGRAAIEVNGEGGREALRVALAAMEAIDGMVVLENEKPCRVCGIS